MRKLLSCLLIVAMLATLVACGGAGGTTSGGGDDVLPTPTDYEKPVTEDTADYRDPHSSSYDAQAEARRQEILNTADSELKPADGANTYYISFKGDDANDGLSKKTPWKTTKNLNNGSSAEAGAVILFERGGVYRNVSLRLNPGVSVGAFGEGPKPQLLGSDKDYADENLWTKTSTPNVWQVTIENYKPLFSESSNKADVGNIIFDHGKKTSGEQKCIFAKDLQSDYDFCFDADTGKLSLYLSTGNPAAVHSSIEMAPNKHILCLRNSDHIIENLCIKYTGAHGISAAGTSNITVRGCEIGWIGGAILSGVFERYGNGIEFFNTTSDCVVENNWIYQCYDAGYTNQSKSGMQKNITVKNNIIEYCLYNIELWCPKTPDQAMKDCTYENNILRFAGFGFGTFKRPGGTPWVSHITFNSNDTYCDNVVIKGNVLDTSYRYLMNITKPNGQNEPIIEGNTWIQSNYTLAGSQKTDPKGTTASIGTLENTGVQECTTQAIMEASVKKFDKAPVSITLDK